MKEEEYEMPEEYQAQLKTLVELIEKRDRYAATFSSLTPRQRREAQPLLAELSRTIDNLEQSMAEEYEAYQAEQRLEQELYELTYLQDTMTEELFIRVKHLHPHVFKRFEEYATRGMTDEERERQYAIIARREAEELDDILSGKTTAPEYHNRFIKFVLPQDQMEDLFVELYHIAFETDDYYRELTQALKLAADVRREYVFSLSDSLPVRRENLEKQIIELRDGIREVRRHLLEYFRTNRESGKFKEIENADSKLIDRILNDMADAQERLFILKKHTAPDELAEFEKLVVSDLTTEEITEFYERVAEREKKELRLLLRSLAAE